MPRRSRRTRDLPALADDGEPRVDVAMLPPAGGVAGGDAVTVEPHVGGQPINSDMYQAEGGHSAMLRARLHLVEGGTSEEGSAPCDSRRTEYSHVGDAACLASSVVLDRAALDFMARWLEEFLLGSVNRVNVGDGAGEYIVESSSDDDGADRARHDHDDELDRERYRIVRATHYDLGFRV